MFSRSIAVSVCCINVTGSDTAHRTLTHSDRRPEPKLTESTTVGHCLWDPALVGPTTASWVRVRLPRELSILSTPRHPSRFTLPWRKLSSTQHPAATRTSSRSSMLELGTTAGASGERLAPLGIAPPCTRSHGDHSEPNSASVAMPLNPLPALGTRVTQARVECHFSGRSLGGLRIVCILPNSASLG